MVITVKNAIVALLDQPVNNVIIMVNVPAKKNIPDPNVTNVSKAIG
jgi:hypothetical protein